MGDYKTYIQQIEKIEKEAFSDAWSLKSIEETLQQNYNIVFLLLCDSTGDYEIIIYDTNTKQKDFVKNNYNLAGYLLCSQIAGESELLRIAIKSEYQGKKYAKALMDSYLGYISQNCEKVFLEVRESNAKARTLYERCGFNELARRKKYYLNPVEDGIIYEYIPNNTK